MWHYLPLIQKGDGEVEAAKVNLCTAKQAAKQAKRGYTVFMAIVQIGQEEESVEKGTEGTEEQKM